MSDNDNVLRLLGDLLAIMHRDGGHHTADVGLEQSIADAQQRYYALLRRIDDLTLQLETATTWDGKDRRCDHDMKWISDWHGDQSVPGGTQDCSRLECQICGWVDPCGEKPEQEKS